MREPELRAKITDLVMGTYLPKMKGVVQDYLRESEPRQELARQISEIVGKPVAMEMGVLRVAAPTNELIDNLVALYVEASR